MAHSIRYLSNYLAERYTLYIIDPSEFENILYAFNFQTCLAVVCYVSKFRSKLSDTIRRLDELAYGKKDEEISELFRNSFLPQVKEFFKVPKAKQLWDEIPRNENQNLAGFLDFLLQILNPEAVMNTNTNKKQWYAVLQKELGILLAFLGDLQFQRTDLQEVKDLLTEFETVANEAGSLIYSSTFKIPPIESSNFEAQERALLEKIELLNAMIKDHCSKVPELPEFETSGNTDAVDSLFIVDSLLADLEDVINDRFNLPLDHIKDQLKVIHKELTSSRAVLKDIELPHNTDMDEVKECLMKIRDVAYEAQYLINSHVVRSLPLWYLSLRLPAMIQKIKTIGIRLQETNNIYDGEVLGVSKYYSGEVSSQRALPTTGVDNLVIGFEDNRIKILGDLMGGSEELNIIFIVGMAGLGKTTIANKLYNEQSIYDYFDLRAWCVVSQTYQKRNVLINILMSMGRKLEGDMISRMQDEDLGLEIYQSLMGRRYLIVIDDVWHSNVWDDLRRHFPDDKNGSRIMLTSRIKDIAPTKSIFHTIPLLSKVQCWELLVKKVFHKETCPPQLLDIGKSIAAKCSGLPLAVVVVAGILGIMEKNESTWEKVERNLDSYLIDEESQCTKILELSYEHLPNHLKLCFLFLGVFPEDTIIPTRKLMRLWIGEGFIKKEEEQRSEDIAEQYLLELINRSLIEIAGRRSDGGIKACSMHDLLRDMCLRRANEANFLKSIKDHASIYKKHHRLSDYSISATSFRHFGLHCRSVSGHHVSAPSSLFPQMALVRVTDSLYTVDAFRINSDRLHLMVHLRYLVVSRMPGPEISELINLEVLRVENRLTASSIIGLPSIFLKMVKLNHLHIQDGARLKKDLPTNQTNNLKSLSYICIEKPKDEEILRCSPHLRKLKCKCYGNLFPDLRFLTELESLKVVYESRILKGEVAKINLIIPSTIKKLTLSRFSLPWTGMSILGKLPNLHVLKLLSDAFLGQEWKTRDDEFKELRFLKLESIRLRRWVTESEHFPKLQRLVLHLCWEELEIPSELGNIPTLQMIEVTSCSDEINESAARVEEEQHEFGNEELKVFVRKH